MYWAAQRHILLDGVEYDFGDVIPDAQRLNNFRTLKDQEWIGRVSDFQEEELNWEHIEGKGDSSEEQQDEPELEEDEGQEEEQEEQPESETEEDEQADTLTVDDITKNGTWFILPEEVGGNTQLEDEAEQALSELKEKHESDDEVLQVLNEASEE